jgi:hypothetical protein
MAAPAYRSFFKTEIFTASNVGGSGTTVTLTKPSGTVSGDVLIAAMNNIGASRAVTTIPSGWALIKEELVATSPAVGLWVFKKVAGGSEPASYDFTFNYDFNGSGGIVAYSGGSDVSVTGAVTTTSGGSSPYTVAAPAITVPDNDSLLVWIGTLNVPTPTAAATFTAPSGYTKRWEQSTSYNNAAITMADDELATAGSSGAASGSVANASGGTSNALGLLVAIAPTGGASTIAASGSGEVPEIRSVIVQPNLANIVVGNTADLTISVADQDADPIAGLTGTMTSSQTSIATVAQLAPTNALGQAILRVSGVSRGTSQITATFDNVTSNIVEAILENAGANIGGAAVSPAFATVNVGRTQQFVGGIEGVVNPAFTWSVISGGGTISSAGLYTAPSTAGSAVIRATYIADPDVSGDAQVTITVPPTTEEATVTTLWRIGGQPYANQSLDYFIFDANDRMIISGNGTTNGQGQLVVRIPALYIGLKVQVIVNNLAANLSTVGKVQGQQVVIAT